MRRAPTVLAALLLAACVGTPAAGHRRSLSLRVEGFVEAEGVT